MRVSGYLDSFPGNKSCPATNNATLLFKNLQPIGVGAGCGVEGAFGSFSVREYGGLLRRLGVKAWMFFLLRCESAVVGRGADSNRYTLVLTHMI